MKLTSIIFVFLGSVQALASCPETIWRDHGWTESKPEVKTCIMESSEYQQAVSGLLCSKDQSKVSDEYAIFMDYKTRFDEKMIEMRSATSANQKRILSSEVRSIETDWMIYGYKFEIQVELAMAFQRNRECYNKYKD